MKLKHRGYSKPAHCCPNLQQGQTVAVPALHAVTDDTFTGQTIDKNIPCQYFVYTIFMLYYIYIYIQYIRIYIYISSRTYYVGTALSLLSLLHVCTLKIL